MSKINLAIQNELEVNLIEYVTKLMYNNNLSAFEVEAALNKVLIQVMRLEQREALQELTQYYEEKYDSPAKEEEVGEDAGD